MKKIVLVALLIAAPLSGASAMTVAEFLAKADALQKKGMMALFSPDIGILKNEGKSAGLAIVAEQKAIAKAGRKPEICFPEKAAMGSNEVMTYFRGLPAAQRGVTVKTALAGLMKKKYPCAA